MSLRPIILILLALAATTSRVQPTAAHDASARWETSCNTAKLFLHAELVP
jgi:hypothetical protein